MDQRLNVVIWMMAGLMTIEVMMIIKLTDAVNPLAPRDPAKLIAGLLALRLALLTTIVLCFIAACTASQ